MATKKRSQRPSSPVARSQGPRKMRGQSGGVTVQLASLAATSPAAGAVSQLQEAADGAALQRIEDEEALQGKAIQQMEDEELMQGQFIQRIEDEEPLQGKAIQRMDDEEMLQRKHINHAPVQREVAPAASSGGLPGPLKAGIESLSGLSMDGVNVHRNSTAPETVGAHAYAQGTDIHLGPGQDQHLPHEAWHVVQQMQGRVAPTTTVAGAAVNDSASLESEADAMGARAMSSSAQRRAAEGHEPK